MKVEKIDTEAKSKEVTVVYSKWPADGTGIGRIVEWANGEGVDIYLDHQKLEVTFCEANAILALIGLHFSRV